jgi:hypothetical protein
MLSHDSRALFYVANAESLSVRALYRVDVGGSAPGTPHKLSGPIVEGGALYGFVPFTRPL